MNLSEHAVLSKIRELENLPRGWRFGKGIPPTTHAADVARSLYQEFAFLQLKADAFPGVDGSLSLVFYAGETCMELDISPKGGIDLYVEEGKGFDFRVVKDIANVSSVEIRQEMLSAFSLSLTGGPHGKTTI